MVITLSREYGSGGLAVAESLASHLGYTLIHHQLPTVVAARLGTSPEVVAAREAQRPFVERVLRGLGAGTPDLHHPAVAPGRSFDETLRSEIEAAVREYAAGGNVIILGRLGNMILGRGPGRLSAFVHAPREWRRERIVEWFGVTSKEADAEIDRIDTARRAAAQNLYKMAWGDARVYDLTVDTARFGIDGAAEVIFSAVRAAEAHI